MDRFIAWWIAHKRWAMVIPALVSLLLLIPNLGETYLWSDEAMTAAIGRNVLKFGLPYMYDGRNLIQVYPPVYNDHNIDVASPPLSYYIVASSFAIFGVSTATARLPFVVIGVIGMLIFPAVLRRLTDDPWTRTITPLALATSVPFLLYFRQCRYYAVMIVATLWIVWAYLQLIESGEKRTYNAVHFTVAALVLFHSHYFVCLGVLAGLGFHWLLACRTRIPWQTIAGCAAGFAVFTVPWVVYGLSTTVSTYSARSHIPELGFWSFLHRTSHFLGQLFSVLGEDFAPPLLMIIFIWLLIDARHRGWRILGFVSGVCATLVVLNVPGTIYLMSGCVVLAMMGWGLRYLKGQIRITTFSLTWILPCAIIITLMLISETDQVRYLTGAVPFVYIGLVRLFGDLRLRFPRWSIVLLLIFLYTNVFRAAPAWALSLIPTSASQVGEALAESDWSRRLGIPHLLPEERRWYHKMAVIDEAIRQHAVFYLYPYDYLYELTHVYDGPVEGVTRYLAQHGAPQDTVKIDSDSVELIFYTDMIILPEHLFQRKDVHADWVILRYANWHGIPDAFMDYVRQHYDRIELPYPDIPWENRPELSYHYFKRPQGWPPVVVYHYRKPDREPNDAGMDGENAPSTAPE